MTKNFKSNTTLFSLELCYVQLLRLFLLRQNKPHNIEYELYVNPVLFCYVLFYLLECVGALVNSPLSVWVAGGITQGGVQEGAWVRRGRGIRGKEVRRQVDMEARK